MRTAPPCLSLLPNLVFDDVPADQGGTLLTEVQVVPFKKDSVTEVGLDHQHSVAGECPTETASTYELPSKSLNMS